MREPFRLADPIGELLLIFADTTINKSGLPSAAMLKHITSNKIKWNNIAVLSAIFLFSLATRELKLVLDPMLQRDSVLYLTLAETWQETGVYAETIGTVVPPFHLFTIVKMMDLGLNAEVAGRSLSLFLGAMIPVLGYIISYNIFKDITTSLIGVLCLSLHPTLVAYSIQPLRENYYIFMLGLIIIFIIYGIKKRSLAEWGLCGCVTAIAVFCRYEALELFFLYLFIGLVLFFNKKTSAKRFVVAVFIVLLTFILTSLILISITDGDITFIKSIPNEIHFLI